MFCKWCGKTIQATDVKCPGCGRETPPVSDCGGFYNLKTPDSVVPPAGGKTPSASASCPGLKKLEGAYFHDRKAARGRHGRTLVFLCVISVLLVLSLAIGIFAFLKVDALSQEIQQLQQDIEDLEAFDLEDDPKNDPEDDPEDDPVGEPEGGAENTPDNQPAATEAPEEPEAPEATEAPTTDETEDEAPHNPGWNPFPNTEPTEEETETETAEENKSEQ